MLTERQEQLLSLIIAEYVDTAIPVGSEMIVRKFALGVSPATIRNEMGRLEEGGYILQPHTSAGRVPSERGYRYYVEALMPEQDLSEDERRRIRHQFYQVTQELEEWLDLAAAILAQAADNAAVVTAPWSPAEVRLKQLQLVSVQETVVLLVVVFHDGKVRQRLLAFRNPIGQEELTALAYRLNRMFADMDADQIRECSSELTADQHTVVEATSQLMDEETEAGIDEAHLEGLRNVLTQPEFSHRDKLLRLLDVLDERTLPRLIPFRKLAAQGVTILIGSENRQDAMRDCSLVLARYGLQDKLAGALAVVGPTRMRYPRAVSAVRFMASVMDDLLAAYYGYGEATPSGYTTDN